MTTPLDTNFDSAPAMGVIGVPIHLKTTICVVAVNFLYMALLISVVGSGFLAQPMAQLLGGTSQTVWFSSIITIITVALNPPVSQAADYWGRKWFIVVSSGAGFAGSLVVSRAENFGTLVVGFVILALSFGAQSILITVVSEILPRQYRPLAQASINVSSSLGGAIGLLMGGGLLRHGDLANYRIYWYVEAGIFALAMLGCLVGYAPPPRDLQISLKTSEKLRRLDWTGYLLFAPGLALFSIALAWSKNPYSWTNAHILAPFVVGIVMLSIFVVYEWRFRKDGILHHDLWHHRNFAVSLIIIFVEGLAFFSANSYFVLELNIVYGADLFTAGVNFAIGFLAGIAFTPLFGLWSSKHKTMKPQLVMGSVFLHLFFVLMATAKSDTHRAALWVYPVVSSAGLASVIPISMVSAQLATAPELITIASALMVSTRSFGGAVGLAINNSIFNSALDKQIPAKVGAAALPLGLPQTSLPLLVDALISGSQEALATVPGITPEIAQTATSALKEAYVIAFRHTWIASAAFCGLLVATSFFIQEQKSKFSNHVDAPVEVESTYTGADQGLPRVVTYENIKREDAEKVAAQHTDGFAS